LLGAITIILPLLYIELGRPKDLIKAGLNLLVGITLFIKQRVFIDAYSFILVIFTLLIAFYVGEIFFIRWNQLTENEKNRFKTLSEFKKNFGQMVKAIAIGVNNFFTLINLFKFTRNNENIIKKKWVRNNENDNILTTNKNN